MRKQLRIKKWLLLLLISLSVFLLAGQAVAAPDLRSLPGNDGGQTVKAGLPSSLQGMVPEAGGVERRLLQAKYAIHKDPDLGTKLRLVIDSSAPVRVTATTTDTPTNRLVVTIQGADGRNLPDRMALDGKVAEQVTFARLPGGVVQLLIDVPMSLSSADYKVFTLPENREANRPFRVVVDINRFSPQVKFSFTSGLRNKLIVIDPGHGGSDPGAIGPMGTQEKNVTLAVSLQLQELLERAGARVLMTRRGDVDVAGMNASDRDELGARTAVGNRNKADLFVSIHANSFANPAVKGTSTYYFAKSPYDGLLADAIQAELLKLAGLQDRGSQTANFFVIKRTSMPAVLVELAFVSNPDEEKLLRSAAVQQSMAQGIARGLESFFQQAARQSGGGR